MRRTSRIEMPAMFQKSQPAGGPIILPNRSNKSGEGLWSPLSHLDTCIAEHSSFFPNSAWLVPNFSRNSLIRFDHGGNVSAMYLGLLPTQTSYMKMFDIEHTYHKKNNYGELCIDVFIGYIKLLILYIIFLNPSQILISFKVERCVPFCRSGRYASFLRQT